MLRVRGLRKSFHRGLPPRRRRIEVLMGADLEVRCPASSWPGRRERLREEHADGDRRRAPKRDAGEVDRPERLGYCPQVPMVWEKLTVHEHFELFAEAYGLGEEAVSETEQSLLDELQFERYRGYRIEELSGGTRQKLNLALALMHEPQLLLLDEPYSGFDWETYLKFWEMSERRRTRAWAS